MSGRSIVDRVLLFAAAICAAGLAWQLTVLLTSKGHANTVHKLEAVSTPSPSLPAQPKVEEAAVRVVYPDATTAKTTVKATDAVDSAPTSVTAPVPVTNAVSPPPAAAPLPSTTMSASSVSDAPPPQVTNAVSAGPAPPTDQASEAMSGSNAVDQTSPPNAASAPSPAYPAASHDVASLQPMAPAEAPTTKPAVAAPKPAPSGALNINKASIEALNHLRGAGRIGEAIAKHRPYRSVEDLVRRRILRRDVYEHIKGQIAAE